jgi:hypothetical protein
MESYIVTLTFVGQFPAGQVHQIQTFRISRGKGLKAYLGYALYSFLLQVIKSCLAILAKRNSERVLSSVEIKGFYPFTETVAGVYTKNEPQSSTVRVIPKNNT